ncbi:hypothetical protein QBC44DRAFT_311530 [Cladorrhinum sp. PSN332]|nr:hypothetical protein QBC44DRAFT_311530 [Cladorrhinum sp. PSN332]
MHKIGVRYGRSRKVPDQICSVADCASHPAWEVDSHPSKDEQRLPPTPLLQGWTLRAPPSIPSGSSVSPAATPPRPTPLSGGGTNQCSWSPIAADRLIQAPHPGPSGFRSADLSQSNANNATFTPSPQCPHGDVWSTLSVDAPLIQRYTGFRRRIWIASSSHRRPCGLSGHFSRGRQGQAEARLQGSSRVVLAGGGEKGYSSRNEGWRRIIEWQEFGQFFLRAISPFVLLLGLAGTVQVLGPLGAARRFMLCHLVLEATAVQKTALGASVCVGSAPLSFDSAGGQIPFAHEVTWNKIRPAEEVDLAGKKSRVSGPPEIVNEDYLCAYFDNKLIYQLDGMVRRGMRREGSRALVEAVSAAGCFSLTISTEIKLSGLGSSTLLFEPEVTMTDVEFEIDAYGAGTMTRPRRLSVSLRLLPTITDKEFEIDACGDAVNADVGQPDQHPRPFNITISTFVIVTFTRKNSHTVDYSLTGTINLRYGWRTAVHDNDSRSRVPNTQNLLQRVSEDPMKANIKAIEKRTDQWHVAPLVTHVRHSGSLAERLVANLQPSTTPGFVSVKSRQMNHHQCDQDCPSDALVSPCPPVYCILVAGSRAHHERERGLVVGGTEVDGPGRNHVTVWEAGMEEWCGSM